jgi:hypothetical protein
MLRNENEDEERKTKRDGMISREKIESENVELIVLNEL